MVNFRWGSWKNFDYVWILGIIWSNNLFGKPLHCLWKPWFWVFNLIKQAGFLWSIISFIIGLNIKQNAYNVLKTYLFSEYDFVNTIRSSYFFNVEIFFKCVILFKNDILSLNGETDLCILGLLSWLLYFTSTKL